MKQFKNKLPKGTLHLDMFAALIEIDSDSHVLTAVNLDGIRELRKEASVVAEKRIDFRSAEHDYNKLVLEATNAGCADYICAEDGHIHVMFDGNVELVKELLD